MCFLPAHSRQEPIAPVEPGDPGKEGQILTLLNYAAWGERNPSVGGIFCCRDFPDGNGMFRSGAVEFIQTASGKIAHFGIHGKKTFLLGHQQNALISVAFQKRGGIGHQFPADAPAPVPGVRCNRIDIGTPAVIPAYIKPVEGGSNPVIFHRAAAPPGSVGRGKEKIQKCITVSEGGFPQAAQSRNLFRRRIIKFHLRPPRAGPRTFPAGKPDDS